MEKDLPSLIERARRLDRYALEELHDLYYPAVYRYICFRLEDPQACRELASQVFYQFLQTLAKRRPLPEQPLSYLLHWAGQSVDDFQNKQTEEHRRTHKGASKRPGKAIDGEPNQNPTRAAIRGLKSKYQHILAIRFTGENSLEKTAQLTDEPLQKVRGDQWKALHALRRRLNSGGLG